MCLIHGARQKFMANTYLRLTTSSDPYLVWDDFRFPANAFNPPGAESDPDFDTTNGGWLFAASGTEVLFCALQFPHGWEEGSIILPHVHWQKTVAATGNVVWRWEYKWSRIGEVMDASFTAIDATTPVDGTNDDNVANRHLVSSFGEVTTTGAELSDMLMMKISRIGGDSADTYGSDARMLEFDIHIQLSAPGSDGRTTREDPEE
jgi:hypothetical protein